MKKQLHPWSKVGARVQFCGHDGSFIADVYEIGDTILVRASGAVTPSNITRPAVNCTHHITDMQPCYWNPNLGVFCVLKSNSKLLLKRITP